MSPRTARFRHRLAVLLGTLALATVNCDPDTGPNPAARITMTATIDGAAWQASTANHGAPPYANWFPWDSTLAISGIRAYGSDSSLSIVLVLGPVTGPGTVALGNRNSPSYGAVLLATGDIYAHTYTVRWYYTDATTGGSATVTGFDPATRHLDGTFSFTARDSTGQLRQVTQGVFAGTYILPPDLRR